MPETVSFAVPGLVMDYAHRVPLHPGARSACLTHSRPAFPVPVVRRHRHRGGIHRRGSYWRTHVALQSTFDPSTRHSCARMSVQLDTPVFRCILES